MIDSSEGPGSVGIGVSDGGHEIVVLDFMSRLHRLGPFSLASMNAVGPLQLRPVPGPREIHNYEEDLTHIIAELGISGIERLQTLYEIRERRGEGLSDHEVAFALLMQNTRELAAEFDGDRVLAQRLAVEGDGDPGLAPR
ncbi:hypothetical protein EDB19DRAFT_456086 [Suillus lakei]|nr:hypothetical protein EDB19DRAFT_456086 [Suillus lakei]